MEVENISKKINIEDIKKFKAIVGNPTRINSDKDGLDTINRPYYYDLQKDRLISRYKYDEVLKDLYEKKFIKLSNFKELQSKQYLNKEIDTIEFESFDHLWEILVVDSQKKLERETLIIQDIFEDKYPEANNLFYLNKHHRSVNIHLQKELKENLLPSVRVIADCIGKEFKVDGLTFESRGLFVQYFHESRIAFNKLKENNFKIQGGSRNFLIPFDYSYSDLKLEKNNFLNVIIQLRSFNFLNFGEINNNKIEIPRSLDEDKIYLKSYQIIDNFLGKP